MYLQALLSVTQELAAAILKLLNFLTIVARKTTNPHDINFAPSILPCGLTALESDCHSEHFRGISLLPYFRTQGRTLF